MDAPKQPQEPKNAPRHDYPAESTADEGESYGEKLERLKNDRKQSDKLRAPRR